MTEQAFLSLGSLNADFQMSAPEEIGEIETQLATRFARLSGGKAANRALLARRFGCTARLFGRVGDDDLARQALGRLGAEGVDLTGVTVAHGVPTAVSVIVTPPSAKKRIFLAANANASWDAAAVEALEHAIRSAARGSILTMDYETTVDVAARALAAASAAGLEVVIDPSPAERVPAAALRHCAAIAPNTQEAERLTGVKVTGPKSAAAAAARLVEAGVRLACIKLADGGAVVGQESGTILVPAPEVNPVDTTGAGDAFTGALAVGLLQGRPPLDCARLAVAAASMAVTRFGSQHENLVPDQIEPRVAEIRIRKPPG